MGRYERAARYDRRWRACVPPGGTLEPAQAARRAAAIKQERRWDPRARALDIPEPVGTTALRDTAQRNVVTVSRLKRQGTSLKRRSHADGVVNIVLSPFHE